jgi:hypothetical protein
VAPELSEWREFFVTTATVAGALVGLLFVAVSVHLRLLSDEHYVDLRLDALRILLGYVVAMGLSLFALIPQSLAALGQETLVFFVLIVATSVRNLPRLFRSSGVYGRRNLWFRAALLVAGGAATLGGGLALLAGQAWPLQLLAASVMVLIVVSVFRTWDIVFRGARVARPS